MCVHVCVCLCALMHDCACPRVRARPQPHTPPHTPPYPDLTRPDPTDPQVIIKLAAGNGFKKVVVGQDALLATPAASALIRRRHLYGEGGGGGGGRGPAQRPPSPAWAAACVGLHTC